MVTRISRITSNSLAWYERVKQTGKIPFWIIFAISIYVPFEEFIIKWIPGPSAVPAIGRLIPEGVLYLLCIQVVWHKKVFCRQRLKSTPIDILVVAFFVASIISIIINSSNVFTSFFLTLRPLWRYLSVYYIVVNIDISTEELFLILQGLKVTGLIQAVLASIQYFLPESINQIFAPRQFEFADYKKISTAAEGDAKAGSTFGTFDDAAILSSFLLIVCIIFFTFAYAKTTNLIPSSKDIPSLLTTYFAIFASKKRAALLIAFILPVVVLFSRGRRRDTLVSMWFYATLSFVVLLTISLFVLPNVDTSFSDAESRKESVGLSSYFLQILSPEYWEESSQNSRGFLVRTIISSIFSSHSWFGFGPDLEIVRESIAGAISSTGDVKRVLNIGPFEDVYWFAMLAYFGVIGVGIYLFILLRLYQSAKWLIRFSSHEIYKSLGTIVCSLIILIVIDCFIERVLKFRPFSFYFWLLAGLVVNAYNDQKQSRSIL